MTSPNPTDQRQTGLNARQRHSDAAVDYFTATKGLLTASVANLEEAFARFEAEHMSRPADPKAVDAVDREELLRAVRRTFYNRPEDIVDAVLAALSLNAGVGVKT